MRRYCCGISSEEMFRGIKKNQELSSVIISGHDNVVKGYILGIKCMFGMNVNEQKRLTKMKIKTLEHRNLPGIFCDFNTIKYLCCLTD